MPPPPEEELEPAIDGITEASFEEEEEDPEEVEPWVPSSDSEPEPNRPSPAVEPPDPSPAATEPTPRQAQTTVLERKGDGEEATQRWPGWPGMSVFRLVVPADKVGCIIGRGGGIVKRICDETRARVHVLDAERGAANRIVLVSAREVVEAELSPAMNAAIKIFEHITKIEETNSDGTLSSVVPKKCSVRLLIPAAQAVHLIGKEGVTINSIQESTGATIRIIDEDVLLSCESVDEMIVEIHGAYIEVHNALKSVLGVLRKFLVDHGVLHLFERKNQDIAQPLDSNQFIDDYPLALDQDFWLSDQRSYGNPIDSRLLYGHDPSFCDPYSPNDNFGFQVTQTMKIPLPYAEEIIGLQGENIEFIRSVSGAVVVLEEMGDHPDEVLVVITGSSSQVQTAHQLLQEVLSGNREQPPSRICHPGPRLPSSPHHHHSGARLLSSPHTGGPTWPSSPHGIAASRDYSPWHCEDGPPRDHRRYPTRHDRRGCYRPY
ncbi:hypothetical protein HU200_046637 [Digitaria exilis]|uniref:K Homology domain-containing protein n=1 Tax=Digitaria exilis TaxID=1010633 RepID=A0A835EEM1_9POAL|nr:hypothetical protein HU200_046637 [Digitaria exilis]